MKYRKLLRFPIVLIILLSHGINSFRDLIDILPIIRLHLSDIEKEYIINTCLHTKTAECMREMICGGDNDVQLSNQ